MRNIYCIVILAFILLQLAFMPKAWGQCSSSPNTNTLPTINAGAFYACGSSFNYGANTGPGTCYPNANALRFQLTVNSTATFTFSSCGPSSGPTVSVSNSQGSILYPATNCSVSAYLTPGTYYVTVQGQYPVAQGNYIYLYINVPATANPPAGAGIARAIDTGLLICGSSYTDTQNSTPGNCFGNNYDASKNGNNSNGQPSNDIYYKLTLLGREQVSIWGCELGYPTYLHLLDSSGQWIVSNYGNGPLCSSSYSPSIQRILDPGTYYVVAEGAGNSSWDLKTTITTTVVGTPLLTVTPAAATIKLGSTTSFTANGACSYVWKDEKGKVIGSSAQITVAPIATTVYTVQGISSDNSTTTASVTVTVNQDQNYITTNSVLIPGKLTAEAVGTMPNFDAATGDAVRQQQTTYFDELGRPVQQIQVQGSPTKLDVVTPITYDPLGRRAASYLPYTGSTNAGLGNNGLYQADALTQQAAFYQPTTTISRTAQDVSPVAVTQYEASPLSRVTEQGAPGAAWQPGSGHALKFNQRANTAGDAVWQWEYNSTNNTFSSPGSYAAGQLLVKETRDEQNQLVTEYLDKQGKTVLKRVAASTTGKLLSEANGSLPLNAPSGQLTTIRRAIFGRLASGTTSSDAVFDPQHSADVTSYVQQLVSLPNAAVSVPIDYRRLGSDPDPGNGKFLLVEASYAPIGTGADLLTYYVYDNLDNLRLVISPEGVNTLVANPGSTITDDFLRSWCFRYEYDGRHRIIRKQVPGTGPVALVYNQRNQVVLTQDGNQQQAGAGEWSFVKYDGLGRPIMTGIYKTSPSYAQSTIQSSLDIETVFTEQVDNTTGIGYTLTQAFPRVTLTNTGTGVALSESNLLTVNYYDRYEAPLLANNPALACSLSADRWLAVPRGLPTGTSTRTVAPDGTMGNWLTSTSYYDKNYQVVQALAQNQLGGVNTQLMTYDFAGKLLASTTSVTQSGANAVGYKDTRRFTYYGNGLPKETFQQVYNTTTNAASAQPEILLVKSGYNELNQLIAKYLHSADGTGSKFLQKVDYRYNIRGWLTHLNNRDLDNNNIEQSSGVYVQDTSEPGIADPDLFGLELVYNNAEFAGAVSQYNGNIAQAMWQTRNADPNSANNSKIRAYNYGYDPTSRIVGAQYTTYAYGSAGWDIANQAVDFSVSNISYDGNGNLLSMTRRGTTSGGDGNPHKGLLDQLTYSYKKMVNGQLVGSNQLLGVDDAATASQSTHDFKDNGSSYTPSGNPEYAYDQNGNLTSDANKGITSISYTRLNQPAVITFKAMPSTGNVGGTIKYTYSATGTKLTKQVYNGTSSTPAKTTNYAGPVVFETTPSTSSTPIFAQTAEGRVLYIPSSNGTSLPWKYEYHLKDHLGNLRYAFRADKDNNVVTQIKAGMEPASATQEEQQFQHVAETRLVDPDHARTGSYVARLNAGTGRREGPSVRLKVAAGDTIRAEVYGRYDRGAVAGSLFRKGSLVMGSLSAGVPGQIMTDQAQPVAARRRWLPFVGISIALVPELLKVKRAHVPTAYLRYEVFNKDSQLVATKTQPIQRTATDEWQHLQTGTKVDSAGFVQVSLVNESGVPAYFDDLVVNTVAPSPYQENHYDPFGLNLVGIEQANVPNSAFQYNGKEKQEDFNLNWSDYGARMYDMQLGRWNSVDPLAEKWHVVSPYTYALNNPMLFVEPDGRDNIVYLQIQRSAEQDISRKEIRSIVRQANDNFKQLGLETRVKISNGPVNYRKLDKTDALAIIGQGADVIKEVDKINKHFGGELRSNNFGVKDSNNPELSQNEQNKGGNIIALDSKSIKETAAGWGQTVAQTGGFLINHGAGHNAGLSHGGDPESFNGESTTVPLNSIMSDGNSINYAQRKFHDGLKWYINQPSNTAPGGMIPGYFHNHFGTHEAHATLPTIE